MILSDRLNTAELPPLLANALFRMAGTAQAQAVHFALLNMRETEVPLPDDDIELAPELTQWSMDEEIARYRPFDDQGLLRRMGFTDRIPGMAKIMDPDGQLTTWDEAEREALNRTGGAVEARLYWHQLMGILAISTWFAKEHSFMLCDAVGVGKTCQAIGLIMARIAYIEWEEAGIELPSTVCEYRFVLMFESPARCGAGCAAQRGRLCGAASLPAQCGGVCRLLAKGLPHRAGASAGRAGPSRSACVSPALCGRSGWRCCSYAPGEVGPAQRGRCGSGRRRSVSVAAHPAQCGGILRTEFSSGGLLTIVPSRRRPEAAGARAQRDRLPYDAARSMGARDSSLD